MNAVYESLFRRTGIGFGDVKLLAFLGATCGPLGVLSIILVASFLGSAVGLFLMVFQNKTSRTPIPFGPFLCLGWFVAMHDLRGQLTQRLLDFLF